MSADLPGDFLRTARGITFADSSGVVWSFDAATHTLSVALTSSGVADFNEAVDDRVGTLLTDSTSIDFTYTDGSNTLTADINQAFTPTWTGRHIFNPGAGTTTIQAGGLLIGATTAVIGSRAVEALGVGGASFFSSIRYGANTSPATFEGFKSRAAAVGSNTIVQDGDAVAAFTGYGANGTGFENCASIQFFIDGTPGASADMPGRISFYTCADGSASLVEKWRIQSSGHFTGRRDNDEIQLGASADLRLLHDGTNSQVRNDTGELRLQFSTTVAAAVETTGAFDVRQQFQLSNVISPAQLTANTDNWAPTGLSTCTTIRFSTDAARDITGITAQPAGTKILLCNIGTQNAVLKHDVTSTAANRFLCPGSADFTLNTNDSVYIWYDTTSARWRVIAY